MTQPQSHQAHHLWPLVPVSTIFPFHIMQNSTSKSLATQQSITVQFSPSIKQIMPKKVFSVSDPTAKAITLSAVEMNVWQLGEWQVFKWHSCVVTTWCGNNSAQWYPVKWSLSLCLSLSLSIWFIHVHCDLHYVFMIVWLSGHLVIVGLVCWCLGNWKHGIY